MDAGIFCRAVPRCHRHCEGIPLVAAGHLAHKTLVLQRPPLHGVGRSVTGKAYEHAVVMLCRFIEQAVFDTVVDDLRVDTAPTQV